MQNKPNLLPLPQPKNTIRYPLTVPLLFPDTEQMFKTSHIDFTLADRRGRVRLLAQFVLSYDFKCLAGPDDGRYAVVGEKIHEAIGGDERSAVTAWARRHNPCHSASPTGCGFW